LAALRGGVVALLHALAHDAEVRADDQQFFQILWAIGR
jgi:hypothetical protein